MHRFVDMMQYQIKYDEYRLRHQVMGDENRSNHLVDYVHHRVMLMLRYLTSVHRWDHLIKDNYIQSILFC